MILKGIEPLVNGKFIVRDEQHYGRIMEYVNRLGCLWQSHNKPFEMKFSNHFMPRYIFVNEGVLTWSGRLDRHDEDAHRLFLRKNLPWVKEVK